MNTKKYASIAIAVATLASLAVAVPAFAQTNAYNNQAPGQPWPQGQGLPGGGFHGHGGMRDPGGAMRPAVFGTVSAVSGDIITVTGRQGFASTSPSITYTVDATNATVRKDNATSTVSAIAVGDTVAVQGTVSGTNVTATSIRDGVMRGPGSPGMIGDAGRTWTGHASSTLPIMEGNGQPVIAGKISALNGTSLTVTTAGSLTYTVDASNAKILEGNNVVSISSISVGDTVLVQGTVNGTSVTASSVIDQQAATSGTRGSTGGQPHRGFFGGIGQFFMHLFGF